MFLEKVKKKAAILLFLMILTTGMLCSVAEAEDQGETTIAAHVDAIEKYGNLKLDISAADVLSSGIEIGDIVTVSLNGMDFDMPVVTNYADVDQGAFLCRLVIDSEPNTDSVLLAINMGDLATWSGIATKENIDEEPGFRWTLNEGIPDPVPVTLMLSEKGGYIDQLKFHQLVRSNNREDYPDLDDAAYANFREITTTGMGRHALYRSSSPVNPEINRNHEADAASESAGIRTFINMADSYGVMTAYEGYADTYYSGQNIICLNMVVDFFSDEFTSSLARGIAYITENDGPFLVHCNEGKDRAGFASAVLEAFMGADADEITADYMVTYYNYFGIQPGSDLYTKIAAANIQKTLAAAFDLETLEGADLAEAAEDYLKSIGLTDEQLAVLRDKLSRDYSVNRASSFIGPIRGLEDLEELLQDFGDLLQELAEKNPFEKNPFEKNPFEKNPFEKNPFDKAPEIIEAGDYQYSVNDDKESVTIMGYTGTEEVIEIPGELGGFKVTDIGYQAFTYAEMRSVSFPDSVRSIGERSFENCVISDALELPENVEIQKDALSYAELPAVVLIPAGAVVEECAFSYCDAVETVIIGPGSALKSRAFGYCDRLEQVICADGSKLESAAFEYCDELEKVILCGEVEKENDTFSYCGDIEETKADADEYDTWKQGALDGSLPEDTNTASDGSLSGDDDPVPADEEERSLEILGSPASRDGVTVTLETATAGRTDIGGFGYTFGGTIENDTDEGIMQVVYTFALIDENGEEFRSFGEVYDGEDEAIPPHSTIDFFHDGIKWGPQSVPVSVKIGISSVKTEAELPPARIPQTGECLYEALEDEKLANIKEEPPVELSFHIDQGGYGRTATFTEGEALDRAVELLCNIRIGEETNEWVTDNYNWISLTWEDGTSTGISLNLHNLEYFVHSTPHMYRLENLGEFWSYAETYLKED